MKEIVLSKQAPIISMNFEEVKASLVDNMEKYKGIVVTDDSLKDCKATQKELAGLRNKLDGYRKEVKKEMEKPIKAFETECKELMALVEEVEKPIKIGINEFDNKKKELKRVRAQEIIANTVIQLKLEKKYADQLTVLDKYTNLTATEKSIVEDIKARAELLLQQQGMEKAKQELIKGSIESTLETVNTTINKKLTYEDFEKYIELGWDAGRIIREINERAKLIREAEAPKKEEVVLPLELAPQVTKPEISEVEEKKDAPKYYVDVYVESDYEKIQALSQYLKANGYKYEVRSKGKVKEE